MSEYTDVWSAFPIRPSIYECCFLSFITCCWNSSSFWEYSLGSLCVRVVWHYKASPACLIIRTHLPVLALNLPVFAGIGISHDSSSALVCITYRVIGKPSLCLSHPFWIACCSRLQKRPVLGLLNDFRDEFAFLIFSFICRHLRTLASVNVKLLSCRTIVRNLCVVNYHHLEIYVIPSWARCILGARWYTFFNKIVASAHNYWKLTGINHT
jgi:hypothetical protein